MCSCSEDFVQSLLMGNLCDQAVEARDAPRLQPRLPPSLYALPKPRDFSLLLYFWITLNIFLSHCKCNTCLFLRIWMSQKRIKKNIKIYHKLLPAWLAFWYIFLCSFLLSFFLLSFVIIIVIICLRSRQNIQFHILLFSTSFNFFKNIIFMAV